LPSANRMSRPAWRAAMFVRLPGGGAPQHCGERSIAAAEDAENAMLALERRARRFTRAARHRTGFRRASAPRISRRCLPGERQRHCLRITSGILQPRRPRTSPTREPDLPLLHPPAALTAALLWWVAKLRHLRPCGLPAPRQRPDAVGAVYEEAVAGHPHERRAGLATVLRDP